MAKRLKIGDIIKIPLENGKYGYCQYVFADQNEGPLIQVFKQIDDGDSSIESIINSGSLFPPVVTGVRAAIQKGGWEIIGHHSIDNFNYPMFRATNGDPFDLNSLWFICDGSSETQISPLPKTAWSYEYLTVWSPYDVAERILSGVNRYQLKNL